ncbi:hypothetical protein TGME49_202010 [Toxoplasma gondii ME49]|uniref:Uncharacterized protein n=1 Tax=Toxoplasma gondii (strain ATCC 50611 / Me49) TaxID=508771 RepID=S8F9F0_TOXGM|nr:hypothetical protein TGME49_202010 [Toxoplasma gondii ME49]EPT30268.1 hypothetical protein TGME49_202010 [Toxoplasma gondii ME49]|eukprot:XP_002367487.1 hypothetical protein TGME49_202010 [Toxoplasma gondii ME49]
MSRAKLLFSQGDETNSEASHGQGRVFLSERSAMGDPRQPGALASGNTGHRATLRRPYCHVMLLCLLAGHAVISGAPRTQPPAGECQRFSLCGETDLFDWQQKRICRVPRFVERSSGGSPRCVNEPTPDSTEPALRSFLTGRACCTESLIPLSLAVRFPLLPTPFSPALFLGAQAELLPSAATHSSGTVVTSGEVPSQAVDASPRLRPGKNNSGSPGPRLSKHVQDSRAAENATQPETGAGDREPASEQEGYQSFAEGDPSPSEGRTDVHAEKSPSGKGEPQQRVNRLIVVDVYDAPASAASSYKAYGARPHVLRSSPSLRSGPELRAFNTTRDADFQKTVFEQLPSDGESRAHPFRGQQSPAGRRESLDVTHNADSGQGANVQLDKPRVDSSGSAAARTGRGPARASARPPSEAKITTALRAWPSSRDASEKSRSLDSRRATVGNGVPPRSLERAKLRASNRVKEAERGVVPHGRVPRSLTGAPSGLAGQQEQDEQRAAVLGRLEPKGDPNTPCEQASTALSTSETGMLPERANRKTGEAERSSATSEAKAGEATEPCTTELSSRPSSPSAAALGKVSGCSSEQLPGHPLKHSNSSGRHVHPNNASQRSQSAPPDRIVPGPASPGKTPRRRPSDRDGDGTPGGGRRLFRGWQHAFSRARLGGAFSLPEDPVANDWAPDNDPKRLGGAPLFDFSEQDLKRMGFETPMEQTPSPSQDADGNYRTLPSSMFLFAPGSRRGDPEAAASGQRDDEGKARGREDKPFGDLARNILANAARRGTDADEKNVNVTKAAGSPEESSRPPFPRLSSSEGGDQDALLFDDIMEAPTPTPSLLGRYLHLDNQALMDRSSQKSKKESSGV